MRPRRPSVKERATREHLSRRTAAVSSWSNKASAGIALLHHTSSTVKSTVSVAQLPQATKDVSSQSTVMCGETPLKGDLKGLIQYAIHLFVP